VIDYFQSQRLAEIAGVSSETIEKDYFIELILFYLAKNIEFKEKLIFRGGTALKKIYFSDYRFSEDLDFLVGDKENFEDYVKKFGKTIEKINLEYPYDLEKRFESEIDRLQFFISYDIIPEIRAVKELKIDVLKDDYIPPTLRKRISFGYQEFKHEKTMIRTYTLESVAVDKICRILDVDNEPRDLYDLWYLLKLSINPGKIKKGFTKKFGYDIYYPNLLSAIGNEDYRQNWEIRLTKQIKDLPHYEFILNELEELIEKKLIGA
jgi:predicted nucleotidyltransferase component of viral defense system